MSDIRAAQLLHPGFAATARVHAFDALDNVVLSGLAVLPGELVTARTTVAIAANMVGSTVVVVFENGDPRLPIVIGVVEQRQPNPQPPKDAPLDGACGERVTLMAQRELTLRCGEASLTLTRAGKVLIAGHYILTRSSGYNRIKGAVIDIN